jgi:hypothetical protein
MNPNTFDTPGREYLMKTLTVVLLYAMLAVSLVVAAQAPVNLGSAANFAVLAGATVTNTGATQITGNLGVSPGTAVTGFPPGIVTGTIFADDPTSAQAIADLSTAFNDAAGRTVAPVSVAGNIGGLTLPPGLYKSTSSLAVSSGVLTLNGQGNANAVFIFQIASSLTTTTGTQVNLINGAQAANVFWQVGSSATLGTTSTFVGTIMAYQSISLATGATLNGRALAEIGAVTLQGNTVVLPQNSMPVPPPVTPPGTSPGNPAPSCTNCVVVPNLEGLSLSAATQLLNGLGLALGTVTNSVSGFVPAGEVIVENPIVGQVVKIGSAVNVSLSTGTTTSVPTPPCTSLSPEWIVPQVADGAGWKTEIYIVNTAETGAAASFTLRFYGDSGQPQQFTFEGINGPQSTLTGTLSPSQSTVFRTAGTNSFSIEGWADFNTTSVALNGTAVYTSTNDNTQVTIPFVIPAAGDLILPFDNTLGYGMGIAIVNRVATSQTIQITILDQNAAPITTGTVNLDALGHTSLDLAGQYPLTANKLGVVIFKGAGAILGIRYTKEGAFTSEPGFPVVE